MLSVSNDSTFWDMFVMIDAHFFLGLRLIGSVQAHIHIISQLGQRV